ncbi:MAG: hypothetical protein ABEK50_03460 [bacterium]
MSLRWSSLTLACCLLVFNPVLVSTVQASSSNEGSDTESIVICHYTNGDTGPREERNINRDQWASHRKHGDSKGQCSGLTRVKSYETESGIRDFKMDSGPTLRYLQTSNNLKVYQGDSVTRSLEVQSNDHLLLSKGEDLRAVKCTDKSADFESEQTNSLICRIFDGTGTKIDTASFSNHSHALALEGSKLAVSEQGELRNYDLDGDTVIWELAGTVREYHLGEYLKTFLSTHTEDFQSVKEYRRYTDGSLISRKQISAFHHEISRDGKYFYLVRSNPGSRTKTLVVFDRRFNQLGKWTDLPFRGRYDGEFSTSYSEVYVPLENGKLLIGDIKSGSKRLQSFPNKPFTPIRSRFNRSLGLLFIYGYKSSADQAGFIDSDIDRSLIIYDVDKESFLEERIRFSASNYDFSRNTGTTNIRFISKRMLGLQHTGRLELYELRNF